MFDCSQSRLIRHKGGRAKALLQPHERVEIYPAAPFLFTHKGCRVKSLRLLWCFAAFASAVTAPLLYRRTAESARSTRNAPGSTYMKRLLTAAVAASVLGACHFHSRAWVAQHANDKAPAKVVADTQPVVSQAGEPARKSVREPVLETDPSSPSTASQQMTRSSIFTSDGRTVGRFLMANDVVLSFAKIAYANSGSEEVRGFARRMLTDHTQLIATMRALSAELEISPSDDGGSRDLRDFSTLQRDSLRALDGRAFDNAYVAMELDRHRAMLSMIDDVLLPRAHSGELRELLASARPIIAAHVAHAEQLQATLARR